MTDDDTMCELPAPGDCSLEAKHLCVRQPHAGSGLHVCWCGRAWSAPIGARVELTS